MISKWNTKITNKSKSCILQTKNAEDLIFECINIQNIWNVASNFDIFWKHIVVGFYLDRSETRKIYNSFVSYIAYRLYKSKIYCRIKQIDETCTIIYIKKTKPLNHTILCKTKKKLFETFVSKLFLQYLNLLYKLSEGSVLRRVQGGIDNLDSMACGVTF